MPFELTSPTSVHLCGVQPREEFHGDDRVVAITLKLRLTGPNTLLDLLHESIRPTLYMAVPGQEPLPGVEPSTPLLRCSLFDVLTVKGRLEGWTLMVDHGIDESSPITMGSCNLDKFKLEAMEGGSVKLTFNVGTNDVSAEEIGLLCGKLGQEISIQLTAPKPVEEPIDGSTEAFKRDHPGLLDGDGEPDATDAFVGAHAGEEEGVEP